MKVKDSYFKVRDISYIGPLDYTVNHSVNRNSTNHYFMVIVGGQIVKVSGDDLEEATSLRRKLINCGFGNE